MTVGITITASQIQNLSKVEKTNVLKTLIELDTNHKQNREFYTQFLQELKDIRKENLEKLKNFANLIK